MPWFIESSQQLDELVRCSFYSHFVDVENEGLRDEVSGRLDSNPVLSYYHVSARSRGKRELLCTSTGIINANGSDGGPAPCALGLGGQARPRLQLSGLGWRDAVYCWKKKRFQVSISDRYAVLFVSQKKKKRCWDMAFWKPRHLSAPGEEEMGFWTDFISSVRSSFLEL